MRPPTASTTSSGIFRRPSSRNNGKGGIDFESNPKEIEVYLGSQIRSSRKVKDSISSDLDNLVKTVNNLNRKHEVLALLNDKNRSLKEKRLAIMTQNNHGVTALFWAVRRHAEYTLIKRMVEIGGKELVLLFNKYEENVLHNAALCDSSFSVFKILIDAGGDGILLKQDLQGNTPLHYACAWIISDETLEYMARKGGKRLLLTQNQSGQVPTCHKQSIQKLLSSIGGKEYDAQVTRQKQLDMSFLDLVKLNRIEDIEVKLNDKNCKKGLFECNKDNGLNSLMQSIWFLGNVSPVFRPGLSSIIHKMVKKGGRDLVLARNQSGSNAVHYAAFNGAPLEIIMLLVDSAGSESIEIKNAWDSTPLHDACLRQAPDEVIEYLIIKGGSNALKEKNKDRKTPLDLLFDADEPSDHLIMTMQEAWYSLDKDCAKDCSSMIVMKTLKWANGVDPCLVTSNNFVKAILNERFILPRNRFVLFTDLYAQLAIFFVLSPLCLNDVYLNQGNNSDLSVWITILTICGGWFMGRELFDFASTQLESYVKSYRNAIDIIQLILLSMVSSILTNIQVNEDVILTEFRRSIFVASLFVAAVQLLIIVGNFIYSVSVFTYAVVQIILKLAPFMLTISLVVIAFSQMFFVAGSSMCDSAATGGLEWQCDAKSSLFQSFGMMLSTEYDFMTWEGGNDYTMMEFISFSFAIIVGILLLNILIAVVNNVFTQVSDDSEAAFWMTRLDVVVELNSIRNKIKSLFSWMSISMVKRELKHMNSSSKMNVIRIRKDLNRYDDKWMKMKCSKDDLEIFFHWWYYSWKKERPSLLMRLRYFYCHATVNDILFPGQVFINILFGKKYNEETRGIQRVLGLILSLIHFALGIIISTVIFFAGLSTWGLLWPRTMLEALFYGPIESSSSASSKIQDDKSSSLSSSKFEIVEHQISEMKLQNAVLKQQNEDIMAILNDLQS